MTYPPFIKSILREVGNDFQPVKLGTPNRGLSLDMIVAITRMVNTGVAIDMPENDESPDCTFFDKNPKRQVIAILFKQRENDPDPSEEEADEQKMQRGEVLVLQGDPQDVEAAAKYSKANASDYAGDSFEEWAQESGFPSDMWRNLATLFKLAFSESPRQYDYEEKRPETPEEATLNKYNVADYTLCCPLPDSYESGATDSVYMNAIFFFKSTIV